MRLAPRKGGHGHVTAYNATLGSAEARRAGFINEDGSSRELEKVVDEINHTILIRLKAPDEDKPGD